jgi:hypothetical protein
MRIPRIFKAFAGSTHRFRREEHASLTVEAVLVLPLLLWCFAATFTYFDVFRANDLAIQANYAVSDLISRETQTVKLSYVRGMGKVYGFLTRSSNTSWIRATLVTCTEDCDKSTRTLSVAWSASSDTHAFLTDAEIKQHFDTIIPVMGLGEAVIVMESTMTYKPLFSATLTGVGQTDFTDIVTTRPRFVDNIACDMPQTDSSNCN